MSFKLGFAGFLLFLTCHAWAGTQGSISGVVLDDQGNPVSSAKVELLNAESKAIKEVVGGVTGEFAIFPLDFGDYFVTVSVDGFAPFKTDVHVSSGARSLVAVHLAPKGKEMLLEVKAKKHVISNSAGSSVEVNKDRIETLPMGQEIKLPKLLQTTTPGIVEGPFGQSFIRGNHANIQYQIDGVQLPDSPSNTFGETFSPRNIDHMEVITGGVPAEYGERLAAVVNIITKTGTENPGGNVEVNYGSYNTTSDSLSYGGSSPGGDIHYYLSANYNRTDRGLDTPQPQTESIQSQGGQDAVHDQSNGNNEFAKIDWIADNNNKYTLVLFNAQSFFQIPNYPSSFQPTDAFFQPTYTDAFGNGPGSFIYTPSYTDDSQSESNDYVELVWKHSFSSDAFLQIAPYWKYSNINVQNDQANDLASFTMVPGSKPASFAENRGTNNYGLKGDYTYRQNDQNLWKSGFQGQGSQSTGPVSIISYNPGLTTTTDNSPSTGYFESVYIQDDYTISKQFILNAGIRFDATQFTFANASSNDYQFGPRVGLNYLPTESTKLHAFYGRLFQPAPVEDLRDSFINSGGGNCPQGQLCSYDIKAEKDDYFEVGVAQALGDEHFLALNVYYKSATNMLDDNQLLNTSIAQPFNFANGYAEGAELSLNGRLSPEITDYVNYSYEIAKGQGISGGIFSFPAGQAPPANGYLFLDHVQIHTVNSGATYAKGSYWFTLQAFYGSGLRTGPNNSSAVPPHTTMDGSLGYKFHGDDWYTKFKLSLDVTNIFNNVYPITIANGFNGSHYVAGSQIFIHLNKDL